MRASIHHLALLLWCALLPPASRAETGGTDSTAPLVALNVRGDSLRLDAGAGARRLLVILYNEYSCRDCFIDLMHALERLAPDTSATGRAVLMRAENNVFARRAVLAVVKPIFPSVRAFYFDAKGLASDPWPPLDLEGGLFGALRVSHTPAILVVDDRIAGGYAFISYDDMYPSTLDPAIPPVERLMSVLAPRLEASDEAERSEP